MNPTSGYRPVDPEAFRAIEEQIAFVLSHPGTSAWLKNALSGALLLDPVAVLNDLEILNLILGNRSNLLIAERNRLPDLR